jgi:hypothetical protein
MRLRPLILPTLFSLPLLACQAPKPPAAGAEAIQGGSEPQAPVDVRALIGTSAQEG